MIHLHMSADEYHSRTEIGSSRAKLVLDSIQLLRDDLDGLLERKQTSSMHFGTLAHLAILEPEKFRALTTATGPINERTGQAYGKETKAFQTWQSENPGVTVVDPSLFVMLDRMPTKVRDLLSKGDSEVSAFGKINGVDAKCRPDKLDGTKILDLKTINDLDNIDLNIRNFRYWFSAAWYRLLMESITGEQYTFDLIFAESKPPYRWRIVDLSPEYAEEGDYYVRYVTDQINKAMETNDWRDRSEIHRTATKPESLGTFDHDNQ